MAAGHAMKRAILALAAAATLAGPAAGAKPRPAPDLTVERVVLVMRHGVRPPTKSPPMPAGTARGAWPAWSTNPGWLTPHGATAIGRLGAWDAARLRRLGVIAARGCPAPGSVRIVADSDQRTIATADAWLAAAAPNCAITNEHKPQDENDPLFSAIESGLAAGYDPAAADAAVADAVGAAGIAALDAHHRRLLARLDTILCGTSAGSCGVGATPSTISLAAPNKRPGLKGALDRASTAAQILVLEYADGKPAAEIGWGRADARDIAALSAFHALEFRLLARPHYVAAANLTGIVPLIRGGLEGASRLTLISGHDTNVANLGGLLGIHWQVPGLATDDPSPGGAIVVEQLKDRTGARFVRAAYRSQTLAQIRSAAPLKADDPYWMPLKIAGCSAKRVAGLCTWEQFQNMLGA